MKIKSWLKYLIYIVLIGVVIYLKGFLEIIYQKKMKETFNLEVYVYMFVIMALTTVAVGVVLGLEYFLAQVKTSGKWKVNVPKIVLLGIPSLYISSFYILAFSVGEKASSFLVTPIFRLFRNTTSFIPIFQIVFGYVLITSFYKVGLQLNSKNSGDSDDEEIDETEETEEYDILEHEMDQDSVAECYCK
jgi:hypothetical protein